MPVLLLPTLAFLRTHWRPFALGALVVAAFLSGRFSRKPSVQTVTQVQTRIEYRDRIVTQIVEKQAEKRDEQKTVVVYRDRVTHRDGTVEDKSETRETDGSETTRSDDKTVARTEDKAGTETTVQRVTVTPVTHDWALDVGVGMPLSLKAPLAQTPFLMLDVSRRVLGPFSLGVWGTLDMNGRHPALGLSVGMSF